ncbi:MAG TPA: FecR family protein [Gemmatimonadaceae bacterium]|jgi:ferric-dicitrate binding protein FerR (iron transport regulator)|nr:FecR family protein [Gemmatimonadaceae bacterium]
MTTTGATTTPFDDDATWITLVSYVSGQATDAECVVVQNRMTADLAYAALVASVRTLWALPVFDLMDSRDDADDTHMAAEEARSELTPSDVEAAWVAFASTLPSLTPVTEPPPAVEVSTAPRRFPQIRARGPAWLRRHPVLWSSVALVAIWLLGVQLDRRYIRPIFYYHAGATEQVVTLPDHSTVWLAPGTYLGTDRTFTHGTRTLYLFGHARFAVKPDPRHPFIVRLLQVRATALGTDFTMAGDTAARVSVNVTEGKVVLDFMDPDGKRQHVAVLTAGQVRNVPALTRWFTKAGYLLACAGVPFSDAVHIQAALLRAAANLVPDRRRSTPHL